MKEIISEDECNDTCGCIWMYQALLLKQPEDVHILSERTRISGYGSERPKGMPNGLTKADREAMKSNDLLKRDFHSRCPIRKMYCRYHGDPGEQWETVCICDI